ncbi:hypothetical protein [Brevundimonas sp. SL130]|uniref:hypothetical protein n=1 Tax=Brevundimonas sp. SL130 TaxID=2995143 RepID=UPI00226C9CDD|nr:hypothetical protein [Brevundimonas sp. SL130]WAC60864.1 hypothetical protein OU998_05310 [Brevundimonas sp. SL130]
MSRRRYLPEPVEVLDPEAWDVPRSLNDTTRRAQTGFDGRCGRPIQDKEDEE